MEAEGSCFGNGTLNNSLEKAPLKKTIREEQTENVIEKDNMTNELH